MQGRPAFCKAGVKLARVAFCKGTPKSVSGTASALPAHTHSDTATMKRFMINRLPSSTHWHARLPQTAPMSSRFGPIALLRLARIHHVNALRTGGDTLAVSKLPWAAAMHSMTPFYSTRTVFTQTGDSSATPSGAKLASIQAPPQFRTPRKAFAAFAEICKSPFTLETFLLYLWWTHWSRQLEGEFKLVRLFPLQRNGAAPNHP